MSGPSRPDARRRVYWALAASLVLHLLLIFAYQLNVETGDIRELAKGFEDPTQPAWSPDGERLIAVGKGGLYEVDPSSGGPTVVLTRDSGGFRDVSWIEDGNSVLYRTLPSSVNRLFVQNLDMLVPRDVGPVTMGRIHPALSPDGTTLAFVSDGIWLAQFSEVPTSVTATTWGSIKRGKFGGSLR